MAYSRHSLTLSFSHTHTTTTTPGYMRNNKRSGQKNLRCFPCCLPTGHNAQQYCGRPVTCEAVFPAGVDRDECVVVAVFEDKAEKKRTQRSSLYKFDVGKAVSREMITNGCRTRDSMEKPLLLGTPRQGCLGELLYDFNVGSAGWHYNW